MEGQVEEKSYRTIIWTVSIFLAAVVALIYVGPKLELEAGALDYLPTVNASINGVVALLLVIGLVLIKQKNMRAHKLVMTTAIGMSVLFLLSYVAYHVTHESTSYGGEGWMKTVYLSILLTHIVLAAVIVPLVLISFVRAWSGKFEKHKKIARVTWPLWFYVSVSGVIVYLMISPYY